MKLMGEELMTSTELMKELFGMHKKLIHNLSEKRRYEKIYEYLVKEGRAEQLGVRKGRNNNYKVLQFEEELYLIPEEIFDEADEDWVELVQSDEEAKEESSEQVLFG